MEPYKIMATIYKDSSPYNKAHIIQYNDGTYSLEKHQPVVATSKVDTIHILKPDETLHSLAYGIYGDSGKWYILAEANGIGNPFKELKEGMKIIIPAYGIIE